MEQLEFIGKSDVCGMCVRKTSQRQIQGLGPENWKDRVTIHCVDQANCRASGGQMCSRSELKLRVLFLVCMRHEWAADLTGSAGNSPRSYQQVGGT